MEKELREKALQTALPENNRGYMIMKKMGYQKGSVIGKNATTVSVPINIEIKKDYLGFGQSSSMKEQERQPAKTTYLTTDKQQLDYSRTIEEQKWNAWVIAEEKRLEQCRARIDMKIDFMRARRVCRTLDKQDNLKRPIKPWFWPVEHHGTSEEEDNVTIPEKINLAKMKQRLSIIMRYMREKYEYCVWCDFKFANEQQLIKVCPGPSKKIHDEIVMKHTTDLSSDV